MTKALAAQIGGTHYKQGIQPFQLSMANSHDGCTHAIQKYLTRYKRKHGILDLQKAHHIAQIRVDTMAEFGAFIPARAPRMDIMDYIDSQGDCSAAASVCIVMMENWFNDARLNHQAQAHDLRANIRNLAHAEYPDQYNEEDFL